MGIRTRFDELIHEKLTPLRGKLPGSLKTLLQELQELRAHPRAIGGWVEEHSPWLSRRALGAASNVAEPFMAGMGLSVDILSEDTALVSMPGGWRNQGEDSSIHVGAIYTLAEFAARIYWEYHLDFRRSEILLMRAQLRPVGDGRLKGLNHLKGGLRARYHIAVGEREALLHSLRSGGEVEATTEIAVFDTDQKLVAELEAEWIFRRPLALGRGVGGAQNEAEEQGSSKL